MKTINLTKHKICLVDDDDFERFGKLKWCATKPGFRSYYAERRVHGKLVRLHRAIMGLRRGDKMQVDHINGNGLDNRKVNLRVCTHAENHMNLHGYNHSKTSHFKGVHYYEARSKFQAYISPDGKRIHLGYFVSEIDAARAYDVAAKECFGRFARTNL